MGSLGGITGSQLRPQAEARAAQPRAGALAYVDPGAFAGELDEDLLVSTVLEVGSSAETAPEHENPAAPLPQQTWSPFAAAYGTPVAQTGNAGGPGSLGDRTAGMASEPRDRQRQAAAGTELSEGAARSVRTVFRWVLLALIAMAAVEAFLLLTAGPAR